MKKYFYILIILIGFYSCTPSEIKVPDNEIHIDNYARQFISYIVDGNSERAMRMISPEVANEQIKQHITNAAQSINQASVKNIKVIEFGNTSVFDNGTTSFYRISYEYTFEKGHILFFTTITNNNGKIFITDFNGQFIETSVSELAKFSLSHKSGLHYFFFTLCILIPIFILTTFVFMLLSKISLKRKIAWGFIILLVSLPRFLINWDTGEIEYTLFSLSLLGAGFFKINLYSSWILAFNIPIGGIIYWFNRESSKNIIQQKPQID